MGQGSRIEGKTMRAGLYVRVSTQEQKQHGLSVGSQIDSLTNYCKEHGYKVVKLYNDAGYSARKRYTSRPALLELLEDVRQRKLDIILFTKLDRWFRSVGDYYEVQTILDEYKVPWQATQEDYEVVTSSGRFKTNIMLSVAQSESDRTSERIKAIHAYRRKQGKYVGTAPTGYKIVNSQLVKDEATREGMELLFKCLLAGEGMMSALRKIKPYGITSTTGHMWRTIRAPAFHGDAFGHQCDPYITPEEHKKLIDSIHKNPYRQHQIFLFSRLVKCGYCECTLYGQTRKRKYKDGRVYETLGYRCASYRDTSKEYHYLTIPESYIEQYLLDNLDALYKDSKIKIKARKKQPNKDILLKRKNSLTAKLERLKTLYVDGDIDKTEYQTKRDEIRSELDQIQIEQPSDIIQLPECWRDIYDSLDREHRSIFWHNIIDRIVVTNDNKHCPDVFFKVVF